MCNQRERVLYVIEIVTICKKLMGSKGGRVVRLLACHHCGLIKYLVGATLYVSSWV